MSRPSITEHRLPGSGVEIHVCQMGDPNAPPLLMIHGIYDRWESWSQVVDSFLEHYQLILVDLRGHGRSDKPETGYELSDYAADMAGVLRALGLTSIPVVGHSLGAMTTAALAAGYPDLVSLAVLEDPPGRFESGTSSRMEGLLAIKNASEEETYAFFQEIGPDLGEERWRDQTFRLRDTADGPFEAVISWSQRDVAPAFLEMLERIQCPVLVMQADPEHGGVLSDESVKTFIHHLKAGRHTSFPGVGHSIHKDQPEMFATAALEFLLENR